jgi:hypothetical protein
LTIGSAVAKIRFEKETPEMPTDTPENASFSLLLAVFGAAKLSGIAGIVFTLLHRRFLGGSLLAIDAVLLLIVSVGSWKAMKVANRYNPLLDEETVNV